MNRYLMLPVHQVLQVPVLVLGMCTNGRHGAVQRECGTHGCIFQNLGSETGYSTTVLCLLSFIYFLCINFPVYTTCFIPFALFPTLGMSASLK